MPHLYVFVIKCYCHTNYYYDILKIPEPVSEPITLHWDHSCTYSCGYMHLNTSKYERSKCCLNGERRIPDRMSFQDLDEPLLSLYKDTSKMTIACNTINNILSFGATGSLFYFITLIAS